VKPPPFAYRRPGSVDEALSLLAEHGDTASVLAGGQSLVPLLSLRMARPEVVVDINGLTGLATIDETDGFLEIGALSRQKAALRSAAVEQACPLLFEALAYVGHPETRSRGTVCGSLAHADPAAELPAVAVALDGRLTLASSRGSRTVAAEDFFVSWFTTAREPDELVTAVHLPVRRARTGWSFQELARRHHEFALVAAAAVVQLGEDGAVADARLVLAGVGSTPVRSHAAEASLRGREPAARELAAAAEAAARELEPASDVHASGAYRRHVAKLLAERSLAEATARAGRVA
jgi:carbon-monoxide dehydrogenase medium subunit